MKKYFYYLIILSLSINSYSQPFGNASIGHRITRMEYKNASGEKGCTYFKYDYDGRLIRALWILNDSSRSSVNYYEYDSEGKIISTFREFSDSLTSFELFTYDSSGHKISERFYRSDGVSGYSFYTYQEDNLTNATFEKYKGWLTGIMQYYYDENNRKKSAELSKGDKVICQISYKYDKGNNLKEEYWDFQGKWYQKFTHYYELINPNKNYYSGPYLTNNGNYRIIKENYSFNNEMGGPSFYYYNSEGLLERKIFVRSDSVSTTAYYKYDEQCRLIKSHRSYSDGSSAQFKYKYDKNNNLILRTFYTNDTLGGFEAHLYNSNGELTRSYLKNFDNWLTGTIKYELTEFGKITSGRFIGENNFNATLFFTYNNKGLVSEILWKFSFGKFQRYGFEYE